MERPRVIARVGWHSPGHVEDMWKWVEAMSFYSASSRTAGGCPWQSQQGGTGPDFQTSQHTGQQVRGVKTDLWKGEWAAAPPEMEIGAELASLTQTTVPSRTHNSQASSATAVADQCQERVLSQGIWGCCFAVMWGSTLGTFSEIHEGSSLEDNFGQGSAWGLVPLWFEYIKKYNFIC